MKYASFLLLPLAAGAAFLQARPDQDDLIRTGKRVFANRCASCHVVPDLSLKTDRTWLEMIQTTAWSGTPGDGSSPERRGIVAYLSSDQVKPAARIDAKSRREDGKNYGRLTVPFDAGSVYLASEDSGDVRVVWNGGGARDVPVGRYRMTHYLVERSKNGIDWTLSGKCDKHLVIEEGKETRLDLDTRAHLAFSLKITHHGAKVQLGIRGDGEGLSIIRDGKLVDLRYKLFDENQRELSTGPMKYG